MTRLVHVANAVTVFLAAGAGLSLVMSAAWQLVTWAGGPRNLILGSITGSLLFGAAVGWMHDPNRSARPTSTGTGWTPPL